MRKLAGSIALAVLALGRPLAAQEAAEPPAAATSQPALPVLSNAGQASAPVPVPRAQVDSDMVAAPPPVIDPAPPPPPPITLVLNTDLGAQTLTVVENGKTKYRWVISSGRRGFATPAGTFQPQWASRMWYSRQYEYAPMPNAVFFHRGTAFHGTSAVGRLGQPASHGCVRLAPGHAAALFQLVHKHGFAATKVVVHAGARKRAPGVGRRGSGAELASLRTFPSTGARVSRAAQRRPSYWED
jgi:lipoprotein-anchoring transpeptidase ErfK/SrfK